MYLSETTQIKLELKKQKQNDSFLLTSGKVFFVVVFVFCVFLQSSNEQFLDYKTATL